MENIIVSAGGLTEWQVSHLVSGAERAAQEWLLQEAAAPAGALSGPEDVVVERSRLPLLPNPAIDASMYASLTPFRDLSKLDLGLRLVDYLAVLIGAGISLLEPTPIGEAAMASAMTGFLRRRAVSATIHSPVNPGPLSAGVASTFRGASYREVTYDQVTTLYRVYGGKSGQMGSFWTATPPTGALRSRIDLALNPQWGNTANQVVRIDVPAGVRMYEGYAASQGGLVGGGTQVFIPQVNPLWIVK
jgi:hypothetical protein